MANDAVKDQVVRVSIYDTFRVSKQRTYFGFRVQKRRYIKTK